MSENIKLNEFDRDPTKMFVTLTPKNIDSLSESEILDLIDDRPGVPKKEVRLKIIKMVYEILGFDLSNDALLCLLAENTQQLCLATAGGGKTTFAQIKITLEKLWRKSKINPGKNIDGRNVLCLVYNRHNKRDMITKQKTFVSKINAATNPSTNLDSNINALTMHAFCNLWGNTYAMQMGLLNFKLLTDSYAESMMNTAIDVACKKFNIARDSNMSSEDFVQLYNYHRETMKEVDELTETDKFIDVGQSVNFVCLVFKLFNSLKHTKKTYDFTDMLLSFYELILKDKNALEHIRSYYDYIIADEVQDFTPIMWKILRLIAGDDIPLLCIGDEDQNIYSFRGADIYDTLEFKERFSDAETFLLSRNRRCREEILNVAKSVICKNSLRFSKEIQSVKDGGNVELIKYAQQQGEYFNLLKRVKRMSNEELFSTVIAYREKDTSAIFVEYLANADIPFYVISGYKPYSHELYKHVFNVLDLMEMPGDSNCLLNLYKVLPLSRAENFKILDYNPATYSFGPKYERNLFPNINYGSIYMRSNFAAVMQDLTNISNNIETAPLKSYFSRLFSYIKSFYWDYRKKLNNNPIDDLFEIFICELFNSELTYPEFVDQISKRKDLLERYNVAQSGLAVSTFHALKGLEFDNVILINMDDEIFPNYSLIDNKDYSKDVKSSLKEAERRLFYVAITRARNNLTIYYNEENPSSFMSDVFEGLQKSDLKTHKQNLDTMSLVPDEPLAEQAPNALDLNSGTVDLVPDEPLAENSFDNDESLSLADDDDIDISIDDNGNIQMQSVLSTATSDKATDAIENVKTNLEFKREIEEDIKDVTNVELGETMKEMTHQESMSTSNLRKLDFKTLNSDKKSFKSSDSYISRLFSDY